MSNANEDKLFVDTLPIGRCAIVVGSRRRAKRLMDALIGARGHAEACLVRFVICRHYADVDRKLTGIRVPVRIDLTAESLPVHVVERVRSKARASNALFDLSAR